MNLPDFNWVTVWRIFWDLCAVVGMMSLFIVVLMVIVVLIDYFVSIKTLDRPWLTDEHPDKNYVNLGPLTQEQKERIALVLSKGKPFDPQV